MRRDRHVSGGRGNGGGGGGGAACAVLLPHIARLARPVGRGEHRFDGDRDPDDHLRGLQRSQDPIERLGSPAADRPTYIKK